ncbi:TRAP transporter substrate-binding protein DctP [Xenophilus azovorans]|uniref:TRAP transporter substrate-binding protein n=1 Tax=Xenophilus azovorans TaxID=151755 RepID=UPI0005700B7F|nr:TRAP transporter substrate-binding protein DctP [Xenophilus azovorans]
MKFTACTVLAATLLATTATAQTVELKLADRLAQDHYVARYSTNYWIDEVQKATDGAVKIERYPSERLGKSKDMMTLTKAGITDIGEFVPGYLGDPLLLSTVAELPGILPNACAASLAYEQLAKPGGFIDRTELAPQGLRLLYVVGLPAYQLFTSKKFDNLSSMKGLKIRSSGPAMDAALRVLGMVPIRMSAAELSESFSRGTVDGMAFPGASVFTYDLQGKTKYGTTNLSFGSSMTLYAISTRSWGKLSPAQQKILSDIGDKTTRRACELIDKEEQDAIKKLVAASSMTPVILNEADRKKFDDELATVAQEWADAADRRGRKGSETLAAFRDAVKPYR